MLNALLLGRALSILQSRLTPVWIACVLGVGAVLSLGLFFATRGWEQKELEKSASDLARESSEKLHVSVLRSMEVLYSIASLHASQGSIDRRQFRQFVQPTLERQPELQALSWNPVVSGSRRAEFEAAAVTDGFDDFQFYEKDTADTFKPAGRRAEYVPVYFIEPVEGNAAALGYDLYSDTERLKCLERARDTGKPVATASIHLAQGPADQAGLLVLLPVFSGGVPTSVDERRLNLAGFAVAVFRVKDLVSREILELKRKGITASLHDESPSGQLIYSVDDGSIETGSVVWLEVASRRWALVYSTLPEFVAAQTHFQSWLVLAGGMAFTFLTTAYVYGGWRRTQDVAAANTALQDEVAVRKRAEAAADAANSAKSDFLASMSHEIRTPLNAILGYTQLMQRDPQLPLEQRDAVGGISASGRHLLGLINEILDLSKIEAGRMELNIVDFDLVTLADGLEATFRPLCAQKKISFRLELEGHGQRFVRGDEGKLRQVLINLLGNAAKFTTVGEVVLLIKSGDNAQLEFSVVDTGLGIPEEEQAHIFNPFHQGSGAAHQGGTGLGLAIAKRQVELLGGRLELQSHRGIGSRFSFTIGLVPAEGEVAEAAACIVRLPPGHSVCALVVDDNKENRQVLGGMLSAAGIEVIYASDGDEALVMTSDQQLDIVFLDWLLPGLSGAETAGQMLAQNSFGTLKIVAHTASALSRLKDEALAAGCVDFIAKPFSFERLYECLEQHLGVEFEREKLSREIDMPSEHEIEEISLPGELCARLMVAAELHSTTALKACLHELRQLDPKSSRLADEIRRLMRSYDMDGIQRLLSKVLQSPLVETTRMDRSDEPGNAPSEAGYK